VRVHTSGYCGGCLYVCVYVCEGLSAHWREAACEGANKWLLLWWCERVFACACVCEGLSVNKDEGEASNKLLEVISECVFACACVCEGLSMNKDEGEASNKFLEVICGHAHCSSSHTITITITRNLLLYLCYVQTGMAFQNHTHTTGFRMPLEWNDLRCTCPLLHTSQPPQALVQGTRGH